MALYDWFNRLIKRREITGKPQTAGVTGLAREFAEHPSRGLTPARLAAILEEAEQGDIQAQCDLYADMEEKDGHIFAEMSKRRRALLALPWSVEPPPEATAREERAAADIEAQLKELDLDDILLDMADAIGYAFSLQELEWKRIDGTWHPRVTWRPQRWFRVAGDEIRLRDGSGEGAPLRPGNWICHIHKARPGYLARAGLHRTLAWPYLFKAYSVRDLAEFLEIYGLPARIGTYPSGASDKEKRTLLRAVMGIGHDAAGIIPEGMMIEFKEAAKGGKDPFEYMVDWCERTQSKAILGATLTSQTDSGSGAYALGNVHLEVMRDLVESDARQVEKTLTRDLVWLLAVLNSPITDPRRAPRFVFDTQQPEDLKLYSEALPKLVEVGMQIPAAWAHERLRIPEPDQGEAVLRAPAAPASGSTAPTAASARLEPPEHCPHCAASKAAGQDRPDLAEHFAATLEMDANAMSTEMVEAIRRIVDEAGTWEDLQDKLLAAYGQMDPERLAAVMRLGFAAAELGGRFEGQEGI